MLHDLLYRLRALFRRRDMDADLDDELRFHRERQLQSYLSAGLSDAEARRRLAMEFGGLRQTREACQDVRGIGLIDALRLDLRFTVRSLTKARGFTVLAVLTLGLGLGANTAIFSVVHDVLLRPLPYRAAQDLVVLNETTPKVGLVSVSYPNFMDWRTQSHAFEALAVIASEELHLAGGNQPEVVTAEAVSSNYLSMLGVEPLRGRGFTADEDTAGTPPVALLSYALWQSHFAGDDDAVGRTITLDGKRVTVVGVLPDALRAADPTSLMLPIGVWLTDNNEGQERGNRGDTVVIGRLAAGVGLEDARTEMEGIAARLARVWPATNAQFSVALRPLRDVLVGDVRPALLILFGTVACVLLIACANVANLTLTRAAGRTREMALRMAIGAGRRRIVTQLLVEGLVLAGLGSLAGLALAIASRQYLMTLLPANLPGNAGVQLDGSVLAFTALAAILSTVIFGLAPALQATRVDVTRDLNEGARGGPSRRQQRWRSTLAIVEIALALVLLVGAGLMMRSLSRLLAVDPGVSTDGVVTMSLGLYDERYSARGATDRFWQQLLDQTGSLPGVEATAVGTGVPLTGNHSRTDISIEGLSFPEGAHPHPDVHIVSPGYFRALGIRLRDGRTFTEADRLPGERVGLINQSIADQFFAGSNPVGRRFAFGRTENQESPAWITIAGVVEDTRLYGLDNPSRLEVYVPLAQRPRSEMTLVARTSGDPATLVPSIRAIVAGIDRDQPLSDVATMNELLDASISTRHVTFVLLTAFSALAVVLAVVGIYSVLSYGVAQRMTEFGIRLALGASRRHVLEAVLAPGVVVTGVGILTGITLSLILARLMRTLLFGVSATDPTTFVSVAAGLALVAVLACVIPAWRAVRVDPHAALRQP